MKQINGKSSTLGQLTSKLDAYLPLVIVILSVGYWIWLKVFGSEFAMPIFPEYYLDAVQVEADHFMVGLFEYPVFAKSYLITQYMSAGVVKLPILHSWLAAAGILIGFGLILTCLTFLEGYWLYAGITLAAFSIYGIHPEVLFRNENWGGSSLIIIGGIIAALIYLVAQFANKLNFGKRWLLVNGILVIGVIWYTNSFDTSNLAAARFLSLSSLTLYFSSLLFIFTAAPGPILVVYRLLTKSDTNVPTKNVALNLSIFALIFAGNVLLTFVSLRFGVNIGVTILGVPLLLPITLLAGWFGLELSEFVYENFLGSFKQVARWLYLGLSLVTVSFWSWALATGNDSFLRLLEDSLLVALMAFTIMFWGYILANFSALFGQLPNIYRVVFKPKRLPYWLIWFGVVLSAYAYYMSGSGMPRMQYLSGVYNSQALIANHLEDYATAGDLFKLAYQEDIHAQLSMFGKASVEAVQYKNKEATETLLEGLEYQPSPQAYLLLAAQYQEGQQYERQLETLRYGLSIYPDNWALSNNLALFFQQHPIGDKSADSVSKYILRARKLSNDNPIVIANQMAIEAKAGQVNLETALNLGIKNDMPYLNNLLAVANVQQKVLPTDIMLDYAKDSTLHQISFSYLYNYAINRVLDADTAAASMVKFFSQSPNVKEYMRGLNEAKAISYIRTGARDKALRSLYALSNAGQDDDYRLLYGQTMVISGDANDALPVIEKTAVGLLDPSKRTVADLQTRLLFAELLAKNGAYSQALSLLRTLPENLETGSLPIKPIHLAEALALGTTTDLNHVYQLTPSGQLAWLLYCRNKLSQQQWFEVANQLKDGHLKLLAYGSLFRSLDQDGKKTVEIAVKSNLQKEKLEPEQVLLIVNYLVQQTAIQPSLAINLFNGLKNDQVKRQLVWLTGQNAGRAWPLDLDVVEQTMNQYNLKGQKDLAYDAILNLFQYSPHAGLKADELYILQCFRLKLRSFASEQLTRYKAIAKPEQWQNLYARLKEIDPAYDGSIPRPIE